jgi:AraC-like DNA-binding protein/mannose-6-phosphate isomerase-like protein (cupin superfamily)
MKAFKENVIMTNSNLPIKIFYSDRTMLNSVHPHWHEEIEVLYFLEGSAMEQINESIFKASVGELIIIGSDNVHSTYSFGNEDCKILVMQMNTNVICNNEKFSWITSKLREFNKCIIFSNPIKTNDGIGKEILNSLLDIQKLLGTKEEGTLFRVISAIYKIIGVSLENFERDENMTKKRPNINEKGVLTNTFKLIDNDFNNGITLRKAAEASNFSVPHFSRLFKQSTGMTFKNYLLFIRSNKACKLLQTNKSISEICYKCGFNSQTSFIRAFKKYKYTTPSEYRTIIKKQ